MHLGHSGTSICGGASPEVKAFSSALRSGLKTALDKTYSKYRWSWRQFSNRPPYVSKALDWLKFYNVAVVPTDKDGGFCLVGNQALRRLLSEKLTKSGYVCRGPQQLHLDVAFARMRAAIMKIAAALDEPSFSSFYWFHTCQQELKTLCSPLKCTAKTHKEPMSLRLIHNGGGHPFRAIGKFLSSVMREELGNVKHLYGSTEALLAAIDKTQFHGSPRLVKIDIEDFFLRGEPDLLVTNASGHVPPNDLKLALEDALKTILTTQYVHCNELDAVFQCLAGSGIGMTLSADLANLVFSQVVEKRTIMKSVFRQAFDVQFYGRYMDDIIMVVGRKPSSHKNSLAGLMRILRKCCGGTYALKVEDISSSSVNFLDVNLMIPADFSVCPKLQWSLHRKATTQKVALHDSSFHDSRVHVSWPLAEMKRVAKRCSSYNVVYFVSRCVYFISFYSILLFRFVCS